MKESLKKDNISVAYDDSMDKILWSKTGTEFIDLEKNEHFDFGNHVVTIGE